MLNGIKNTLRGHDIKLPTKNAFMVTITFTISVDNRSA